MNEVCCILAAGCGSRLGVLTENLNKVLLPITKRAIISHIIEKLSINTKIIVAVGYQKDKVVSYCLSAHPNRMFEFVEVDNFDGEGSGPGYSLLKCSFKLQCPFYLVTADCLVDEPYPSLDCDWLGIDTVDGPEHWATVNVNEKGEVIDLVNKIKTGYSTAFIGLAGIYSYKSFWEVLQKSIADSKTGELEFVTTFAKLVQKSGFHIKAERFTWHDTGTLENYNYTKKLFELNCSNLDKFSFVKEGEYTYYDNGYYIKYFNDSDIVVDRIKRAEILYGIVPSLARSDSVMFSYKKVEGRLLYDCITPKLFFGLLDWCCVHLWKMQDVNKNFISLCRQFYYKKTLDRYNTLLRKTGINDSDVIINGLKCRNFGYYFKRMPWIIINHGISTRFHGDLQLDNILFCGLDINNIDINSSEEFVLLDWRDSFAGELVVGDQYYDLAKLYASILMPFKYIRDARFNIGIKNNQVEYSYDTSFLFVHLESIFIRWLKKFGFEINKLKYLVPLIYINMSPLHESPFNLLLFYHGLFLLEKLQKNEFGE